MPVSMERMAPRWRGIAKGRGLAERVSWNHDSESVLRERRQAVRELGAVLRELTEAAVSTEVDAQTLRRTTEQVRELVGPLAAASRTRTQTPSVDGAEPGRRMYNPAVGPGNPLAPPMRVEYIDGVAVGSCTLGLLHEGPPSYCHGGFSALLLDQILGHAHASNGTPGMTVKLSVRYRRPVPLQTPLLVKGWVEGDTGNAKAVIATAEDPDTALVRAEGMFITPSADQIQRLFGDESLFTEARGLARE